MKTENIIGALTIAVSLGAVGCGAAPAATGGDRAMGGGSIASGSTQSFAPSEPLAAHTAPERMHRHGGRVSHMSLHATHR
jgi:hypothetical protein